MTRTCTICNHSERRSIERSLLSGTPMRSIADQFNVKITSIMRHKLNHIPRSLLRAHEVEKVADADAILANICIIDSKAKGILERSENSGDYRTALSAIREIRGLIELLARLRGELQDRTAVQFTLSPDYQRLRTTVVSALAPFPEARIAVAKALQEVEHVDS
jgi:hypothetical protein